MKRCKVGCSCKLLFKLLKIPKKAGMMGIEFDEKHDCIYIYLSNVGKDTPECALAELVRIDKL